jgi:hypothetical protein
MKPEAYVWKEKFSIIKSKKVYPNAFANITDKNEITVIAQECELEKGDILGIDKGWRIITFDTLLPFGMVGFLAPIAAALANEKVSIFVISAFSTDHLLVKEDNLAKTKNVLKELGFTLNNK